MEKEKLTALVEAAKNGDADAMTLLLEYAREVVRERCGKLLQDSREADRITKEILEIVRKNLDRAPEVFDAWLCRIAEVRCENARKMLSEKGKPEYTGAIIEEKLREEKKQGGGKYQGKYTTEKPAKNTSGGTAVKIIASVLAFSVAIGGAALVAYNRYFQQKPAASFNETKPVVMETIKQTETVPETPEVQEFPELQETFAPGNPSHSIVRTAPDIGAAEAEMYLDTPVFSETSLGYRVVNTYFEDMREAFESGEEESAALVMGSLKDRVTEGTYFYKKDCEVLCETELFTSIIFRVSFCAGGPHPSYYSEAITFDAKTGRILTLSDFMEGTEEDVAAQVKSFYAPYGEGAIGMEMWQQMNVDGKAFVFYVEDGQLWVRPEYDGTMASAMMPFVPIGEAVMLERAYYSVSTDPDVQGRNLELHLGTPRFAENTEGLKKVNAFFDAMRNDFLTGKDPEVQALYEAEKTTPAGAGCRYDYDVTCMTDRFVSISLSGKHWIAGAGNLARKDYVFDIQTGERLELTDLVDGSEEETVAFIKQMFTETYQDQYMFAPDLLWEYNDLTFYLEDNQVWVRPNGDRVSRLLPYMALPGTLE